MEYTPHDDKGAKDTHAEYQVGIQTTAGSYDARFAVDNSNRCPILKRMNIARYIISKSPYVRRNAPKYYITSNLPEKQVLKFDIRNPETGRQLWNRMADASKHANMDCVVQTLGQIQKPQRKAHTQEQWAMKQKRPTMLRKNGRIETGTDKKRKQIHKPHKSEKGKDAHKTEPQKPETSKRENTETGKQINRRKSIVNVAKTTPTTI